LARTKITLAWIAALAFATPALAADDVDYVKYRQKVMSGIGADMGAISDILKNGLPFTANVAVHADSIEESASLIASAFEKKVTEGATDAKPEIWQKPDEFKDAIAALEDAADQLEDVADTGDHETVTAAYKELGKACGGCHKPFRKPKEESYKNQ
jgi:cytochrome c556